jgi:hypothetical protein
MMLPFVLRKVERRKETPIWVLGFEMAGHSELGVIAQ